MTELMLTTLADRQPRMQLGGSGESGNGFLELMQLSEQGTFGESTRGGDLRPLARTDLKSTEASPSQIENLGRSPRHFPDIESLAGTPMPQAAENVSAGVEQNLVSPEDSKATGYQHEDQAVQLGAHQFRMDVRGEEVRESYRWGLFANPCLSQWSYSSGDVMNLSVAQAPEELMPFSLASGGAVTAQRERSGAIPVEFSKGGQQVFASALQSSLQPPEFEKSPQTQKRLQPALMWSSPVAQSALFLIDRNEGVLLTVRNFFLSEDREQQLKDSLLEVLESGVNDGINCLRINGVEVWRANR